MKLKKRIKIWTSSPVFYYRIQEIKDWNKNSKLEKKRKKEKRILYFSSSYILFVLKIWLTHILIIQQVKKLIRREGNKGKMKNHKIFGQDLNIFISSFIFLLLTFLLYRGLLTYILIMQEIKYQKSKKE